MLYTTDNDISKHITQIRANLYPCDNCGYCISCANKDVRLSCTTNTFRGLFIFTCLDFVTLILSEF